MDRLWVLDSSPIIALSKASLIWIVGGLSSQIVVPVAVAHEINVGTDRDPAKKWLEKNGHAYVTEIGHVESVVTAYHLGAGESEVISWANRNPSYEAIMDDRAARRCAAALGIRVRGTIGALLLAKQNALIPALRPALDQVTHSGLRISQALIDKALRLVGEK